MFKGGFQRSLESETSMPPRLFLCTSHSCSFFLKTYGHPLTQYLRTHSNAQTHRGTKIIFSILKHKNPTNGIDWLVLGQIPIIELIHCGHKFGCYDWPRQNQVPVFKPINTI